MTKEQLSPEDSEALDSTISIAKHNFKIILLEHALILLALTTVNYFLCKNFIHNDIARFMLYYLTAILIVSSNSKALRDNNEELRLEILKILDK